MGRAERVYYEQPKKEFMAQRHLMPTPSEAQASIRKDAKVLLPPFVRQASLQGRPDPSSIPRFD